MNPTIIPYISIISFFTFITYDYTLVLKLKKEIIEWNAINVNYLKNNVIFRLISFIFPTSRTYLSGSHIFAGV
jgi:hypothetical protein